jgi:ABC-type branched-subunit amino acid transport system substrate-binding protein
MRSTVRIVAASAATIVLTIALAACRGSDGGPTTDDAGIKTDFGVTAEACPDAIDETKGCIYLGTLSDLTVGPFRPLAIPITAAQAAFWKRVNEAGGIGGYEIDVTTYVRDNKYDAQTTSQVYQEIKPNILALAQTLGSDPTAAILPDLKSSSIVAAPAAWTSGFAFEDVILESGANYCVETMNAIDFAKGAKPTIASVMSVHYPGDYGDDAAGGAQYAAEELGLTFTNVPTGPGGEAQAGAISQILTERPDLVIITTGPTEAATIVGQVAAQGVPAGYTPMFVGTSPTWNPALLASPAAPALTALYFQSGPWGPWGTDTPGHEAMREALGTPDPLNDGYTAGWVWSYPIKAALEKAVENRDLTRAGLLAAAKSLTSVDYEGMLPSEAGNYAGGPEGQVRVTTISKPDPDAPTGVTPVQPLTVGPTAEGFTLTEPCYETLS